VEKLAPRHFFLVGIGGIGMQAIADVLLGMGHQVTGSNNTDFSGRERLERLGAKIFVGPHLADHIPLDISELIYTSAITRAGVAETANPEVARAIVLGVPVAKRSVFVGKLMADKIGITVSGTHGKTTTATLLTAILREGQLEPSAMIGAEVESIGGCGVFGAGKYMVVEACEYDRSFLDMPPTIAVITNIDSDHLDYYQNLSKIKEAFVQFIKLVPPNGLVVACGDDKNLRAILPEASAKVITYGFNNDNDLIATDVKGINTHTEFKVGDQIFGLPLPGRHLILNSLAAIAVARQVGVSDETIYRALSNFKGAARRFEILGTINGITLMDDYGHHPTEIRALLSAARDYFLGRKIWVVFQPHQYSRTRLLFNDFVDSLRAADEVIVAPIFAVGDTEADKQLVSSEQLALAINQIDSNKAVALPDFPDISAYLKTKLRRGDVVISLGAGKNSEWIHQFKNELTG